MDYYLTMGPIYRNPRLAPKGFKHWNKDEPLHKIEWGLFLLVKALQFIFCGTKYEAKHMGEKQLWKQKIVKKIEGVDIALELLVSIILQLVSLCRKLATEKYEKLKSYVHKFLKKNQLIQTTISMKMSIQSYLIRGRIHGFKVRNILRNLELKARNSRRNNR